MRQNMIRTRNWHCQTKTIYGWYGSLVKYHKETERGFQWATKCKYQDRHIVLSSKLEYMPSGAWLPIVWVRKSISLLKSLHTTPQTNRSGVRVETGSHSVSWYDTALTIVNLKYDRLWELYAPHIRFSATPGTRIYGEVDKSILQQVYWSQRRNIFFIFECYKPKIYVALLWKALHAMKLKLPQCCSSGTQTEHVGQMDWFIQR